MLCINSTLTLSPESISTDNQNIKARGSSPVRWVVQFQNQSYLRAYSRDQQLSTSNALQGAKLFHRQESAEEVAHLFNAESHRVVLIDGEIKISVYQAIKLPRFDYNSGSVSARVLSGYRGAR